MIKTFSLSKIAVTPRGSALACIKPNQQPPNLTQSGRNRPMTAAQHPPKKAPNRHEAMTEKRMMTS